jgi:hypothetical protein
MKHPACHVTPEHIFIASCIPPAALPVPRSKGAGRSTQTYLKQFEHGFASDLVQRVQGVLLPGICLMVCKAWLRWLWAWLQTLLRVPCAGYQPSIAAGMPKARLAGHLTTPTLLPRMKQNLTTMCSPVQSTCSMLAGGCSPQHSWAFHGAVVSLTVVMVAVTGAPATLACVPIRISGPRLPARKCLAVSTVIIDSDSNVG